MGLRYQHYRFWEVVLVLVVEVIVGTRSMPMHESRALWKESSSKKTRDNFSRPAILLPGEEAVWTYLLRYLFHRGRLRKLVMRTERAIKGVRSSWNIVLEYRSIARGFWSVLSTNRREGVASFLSPRALQMTLISNQVSWVKRGCCSGRTQVTRKPTRFEICSRDKLLQDSQSHVNTQ